MLSIDISEVVYFTFPKLYTGKEWYIGFMAYDPAQKKMRRKRIKINHIEKKSDRKKYARGLIERLTIQLDRGWNPWVQKELPTAYKAFDDVCAAYIHALDKGLSENYYRETTHKEYSCMLHTLQKWNKTRIQPAYYIYQFDRDMILEFLNYIYVERDNSLVTRNKYLMWLSSFSTWLVQRLFLKSKPTDGIAKIKNKGREKDRDLITDEELKKLHDYLEANNKHFLLACYILHYVLIRPKEMSYLKLKDFSLKKQTVVLSGEYTKNRRNAVVTLPAKVIRLMIELGTFNSPDSYYLFSSGFRPGKNHMHQVQFRKYWANHIRPYMGWGPRKKFYSLKDTGITNMIRNNMDILSIRDQARHSSVLMTDMYTPADLKGANKLLLNYEGDL